LAGFAWKFFWNLVRRRNTLASPSPLLIELFQGTDLEPVESYEEPLLRYTITRADGGDTSFYEVTTVLNRSEISILREVVSRISLELSSSMVDPLTFARLVEVLEQLAAGKLAGLHPAKVREFAELAAFEAIGLSRIMCMAKDPFVSEFYVDSTFSPVYLDHAKHGRCESNIILTPREREAIATHMDTFRGYTLDYANPSLKNDLEMGGARLRVSLDLEPVSVNGFALDVRRLGLNALSLHDLVGMGVITAEASAFLLAWLQSGRNLTIVGETSTGKTTLLNALDERLDRRLRRVYVEDAVETKDLLKDGYHQMKIKVDPLDRAESASRTKGMEIVKILHRSPDIVILSELQSEEHSRAFFHALSSGINGMQTFHAGSPEQAIRRWTQIHGIPKEGILDLGLIAQMKRPDKLGSKRVVNRICQVVEKDGSPELLDVFVREAGGELERKVSWEELPLKKYGVLAEELQAMVEKNLLNVRKRMRDAA
jgi:pilus assembly protein CpaF